jgi:hypothetical protein
MTDIYILAPFYASSTSLGSPFQNPIANVSLPSPPHIPLQMYRAMTVCLPFEFFAIRQWSLSVHIAELDDSLALSPRKK